MHQQVVEFLGMCADRWPAYFSKTDVLEIGSMNINGTPRHHFTDCNYLGVDWRNGPDVDLISFGHDVQGDFDVVISTETLEHDAYWQDTLDAMHSRLLRNPGLLIVTTAAFSRDKHRLETGYKRHYRNMQPDDLWRFRHESSIWIEDREIGSIMFALERQPPF